MVDERDTGELSEVPRDQRLDVDGGAASDALEGGSELPAGYEADAIEDAYHDPGEVVEGDLS